MSEHVADTALSACSTIVEHIPDNLLYEPIEYLFADHCRQRDLCRVIKKLASSTSFNDDARRSAQIILSYLERDFGFHMQDEEELLFPMLQNRCTSEDRFTDILHVLQTEHQRDQFLFTDVLEGIRKVVNNEAISQPELTDFQNTARLFSETHLAHLNWENAVVLDLARLRLTTEDQAELTEGMAKRRGINLHK